jgi:hypothetical protein
MTTAELAAIRANQDSDDEDLLAVSEGRAIYMNWELKFRKAHAHRAALLKCEELRLLERARPFAEHIVAEYGDRAAQIFLRDLDATLG